MKKLISGLLVAIFLGAPSTQAGNGNINLTVEFKTHHRSCQEIVDKLNKYRSAYIHFLEHEQAEEAQHMYEKIVKKEEKKRECEKQQKKDRRKPVPTGATAEWTMKF